MANTKKLSIILPLRGRFRFSTNFIPALIYSSTVRHQLIIIKENTEYSKRNAFYELDLSIQKTINDWLNKHNSFLKEHFDLTIIDTGLNFQDGIAYPEANGHNRYVNAQIVGLKHATEEYVNCFVCDEAMYMPGWDEAVSWGIDKGIERLKNKNSIITLPLCMPWPTQDKNHPIPGHQGVPDIPFIPSNRFKVNTQGCCTFHFLYDHPNPHHSESGPPLLYSKLLEITRGMLDEAINIEPCGTRAIGNYGCYIIEKKLLNDLKLPIVHMGSPNDGQLFDSELGDYQKKTNTIIQKLILWKTLCLHAKWPVHNDLFQAKYKDKLKEMYDYYAATLRAY